MVDETKMVRHLVPRMVRRESRDCLTERVVNRSTRRDEDGSIFSAEGEMMDCNPPHTHTYLDH